METEIRNNDGLDFGSSAFMSYNSVPLPLSQAATRYPDMDIPLPQPEDAVDLGSLQFMTDDQSYPDPAQQSHITDYYSGLIEDEAISTDSTTRSSLPLPVMPTSQSSFQTMPDTQQSYLPPSLDPLLPIHQSDYSLPSDHDYVPNESFDVNDMPNSGTWSSQFSSTMVVDDPIPAITPPYSSLYANPHTVGTAKRPLSNNSPELPAPKRQFLTDTHNPGHYVPVELDSVTSNSIWNADRRVESSQSSHQSEGLPGTPMLLEPRTTCLVRQEEIGLDEDAADVCAIWFSKKYSVLPSDQDIEALSHLTKASTTAVKHWFGQMLKQGLAGHDSAYKSQSTLACSQMSLEKQQTSNETTEEIPQHSTEENTSEQRARGSHRCTEGQARRRSGKKSCTPTINPEMLQRDESKIFQCTDRKSVV